MHALWEPSVLRWDIGAAGGADGNLRSHIPISGGKRGWVSASTSSRLSRLGPFLLEANRLRVHLAGADAVPLLGAGPPHLKASGPL